MVTSPALGYIMKDRRQVQQFGLCNSFENRARVRESFAVLAIGKSPQVAYDEEDMLINGVFVEQVILHSTDNIAEFRDQGRQQSISVHSPQLRVDALRLPKKLEKTVIHFLALSELVIDQVQLVADHANSGSRYASQLLISCEQNENLHQSNRPANEYRVIDRLDETMANVEIFSQRLGLVVGRKKERFLV